MLADTTERALESLIVRYLTTHKGYEEGANVDYNVEFAIDETRLLRFLAATQPAVLEHIASGPQRRKFLARLAKKLATKGIIRVLREGLNDYAIGGHIDLYYQTPTEGNERALENFAQNIFSVTRQLRYAGDHLALDMCIFINGLPLITFELKNQLTKQDVNDAVQQYRRDRDPREPLFSFKRCLVHFAVDDARIKFCTRLAGKNSFFLPFDRGYNDGAGNPPNPNGIMTDYLWRDVLTRERLALIIENYAQVVTETSPDTQMVQEKQIFPRYHQLDVVTRLLADVREHGVGQRYLVQHSAGSGKSNSIAWLAHQLIGLMAAGHPLFDSVLVVTDRVILDKQIRDTIKDFTQVASTLVWADSASELSRAITSGKRIIVTTVEKFPYAVPQLAEEHYAGRFAVIIDEAHSGQSGRNSANMNIALSGVADEALDGEDRINRMMEGRRLLPNASYFAFTATPKNKTLEMFGTVVTDAAGQPLLNADGERQYRPFHSYTMKQAIEEGFILDVLKYYTPIDSFYRLLKTVADDPMFDKKRAQKKLRTFVEGHSYTIARKASLMVEHFHEQVIARGKVGGKARAMVVTESIARCVEYYYALNKCLAARNSPYKVIIAFSGEYEYNGTVVTSAALNGFADAKIPQQLKQDPYRILVVADMFQTGFDEPLLHTMYVDKVLYDIKAVQTLSRLNRCHPEKHDTFVLDFANSPEDIEQAFSRYYRRTLLSGETDPNKLYDLMEKLAESQVYAPDDVAELVERFLAGAERDRLDPILDRCAAAYLGLAKDAQVNFKSSAKAFVRTYGFLAAILPYGNADWERLAIFLNLLLPKLPSPVDDDLSQGILETIDLASYRNQAREQMAITLADSDAEVAPVPPTGGAHIVSPELDALSAILADFNDMFGNIKWNDADNVKRQLLTIPVMVSHNEQYQNAMKNSDEQNARLESEYALNDVILDIMKDNIELFKQFQDNQAFKQWLTDMVFNLTYNKEGRPYEAPALPAIYGTASAENMMVAEGRASLH